MDLLKEFTSSAYYMPRMIFLSRGLETDMNAPRKRSRKKKCFIAAVIAFVAAGLLALTLPFFIAGEAEARPKIVETGEGSPSAGSMPEEPRNTLKVMTLNIAHGRKKALNQVLLRRSTIESNLEGIAVVLKREDPDVVALQEADGRNWMSGRFNHVTYLAKQAEFPRFIQGEHVKGLKMAYGTALLSRLSVTEPLSICFNPSPPTWTKGYVVCSVPWPGNPDTRVDVVSVHLDFARGSVRTRQVEAMAARLKSRTNPLIVMGDFNSEWDDTKSAVRWFAEELKLEAWRTDSEHLKTFPRLKQRLDWILISQELEFKGHNVLPDEVSDHLGVTAEIGLRPKTEKATDQPRP